MNKTAFGFSALAGLLVMGSMAGMAQAKDHGRHHSGGPALGLFEKLDSDQSGTVDRFELEAYQASRFDAADLDDDGAISLEEFQAHLAALRAERRAHREAKIFDRQDSDGDGLLIASELSARSSAMFDRLDADGDGIITLDEVKAFDDKGDERSDRGKERGRDDDRGRRNDRDDKNDDDDRDDDQN
ncbi:MULTISPECIES: EF-hand domain-containing protein [unclassified Iodidimonas]|jgi:Ca2+-binding EF-hand superfamily protein|uniref:EF-hand domain-containing protein n=1 Tax=unclassified Iodidimonas TaxID=2626145 RepID=UPI0024821E64|nr:MULTISPECIES: EF-hand domain-containing protein [unclassified Iodidimonas]